MRTTQTGDERRYPEPGVKLTKSNQEAYRLLCKCSYKVRCEIISYGERLGELAFFNDEETSSTQGERIWNCPGCRSPLRLPDLQSKGWTMT
jgi:hypothetical protein